MSLRSKIVLILSVVVLLFALADHAIQRTLVFESFVRLEEAEASKDLQRVVQAIRSELQHLDRRCEGWAAWDDTWNFVVEPNQAYVDSNLGTVGFHKNQINLLYICDEEGKVVWGRILDLVDDRPIVLRELPGEALSPSHPLLLEQGRKAGVWRTGHGPMLVSSKPILDSRRNGPSRGTVLMGRFVAEDFVRELRERTGVDFRVWPVDGGSLPPQDREIRDEVTASTSPVLRAKDDETLQAWTTYADTREAPSLVIRADIARDITADGATSVRYALISTVAAGLLIILVLLHLLQRTVLRPLAAVTRHAVEIGRSDETFRKLDLERRDEIGILSREFDRMMEKLSQSRAALVKAARAAGMSEIATAVLHNVGNVLNSVNVSAAMVAQKANGTGAEDLRRALQAVEESAGDLATFLAQDPRGKHLQPLLSAVADQMTRDQEAIRDEVQTLARGIEHIQELVRSQQDHTGRSGVLETIDLSECVEAALSLSSPADDAAVVREYGDFPPCAVDRHRLTEILVNLVQNARESLQEAGVPGGHLTVRLVRAAPGRVRFEVQDEGVGIPAENLDRVFTHGFTTKKSGHGFGLHASANAARELGGSLVVRSDGPGRGATFVLELPVREVPHARLAGARS